MRFRLIFYYPCLFYQYLKLKFKIAITYLQKMSKKMSIKTILRIRPQAKKFKGIKVDQQNNEITFNIPKDEKQGYINNQKESVKFKFDQIFDMDAPQQKIFDKVAKDVTDKAIEGFNGTIFAYGQTGSGKTYTMTGGGEIADGQGIIPRIIRHVYFIAAAKSIQIKVVIRYLQIYNGVGYDMLDPKIDFCDVDKVKKLQELQKVKPMESGNGDLVLQNLSQHYAKTHQDAMELFIIGDTNRITCKTPKNDDSTRSHCIFMINLQTSRPGTEIKTQSKIYLVDLSSSQNIKQTEVEGDIQKNVLNNNKGLHYLERMVMELNKKMKGQNVHIPYRQSLMNLILRDSIGGNCITRMIATMSPKKQDVMETIATCRFAQRVALIKNTVQRNETVDPKIIARLKRQNELMKNIVQEKQLLDKKQQQNILNKNDGQRKKSVNKTIRIKNLSRQNERLKSILSEKSIKFPQESKQTKEKQQLTEKLMQKKNNLRESAKNLSDKISVDIEKTQNMLIKPLNLTNQDLLDEAKAFEAFRVSSRKNQALQKNTQILKEKMRIGKQVATIVHQSRQKVARLKNRLEQLQRENIDKVDEDPEQQAIRQQMVRTNKQYQEASLKLKALKYEVNEIKIQNQKYHDQIQKDFLKYQMQKHQQRVDYFSKKLISFMNIRDKQQIQKNQFDFNEES